MRLHIAFLPCAFDAFQTVPAITSSWAVQLNPVDDAISCNATATLASRLTPQKGFQCTAGGRADVAIMQRTCYSVDIVLLGACPIWLHIFIIGILMHVVGGAIAGKTRRLCRAPCTEPQSLCMLLPICSEFFQQASYGQFPLSVRPPVIVQITSIMPPSWIQFAPEAAEGPRNDRQYCLQRTSAATPALAQVMFPNDRDQVPLC